MQALFRTKGYAVVRCEGCGLLYRNPGIRPERLGDLYARPVQPLPDRRLLA